MLNDKMFSTKLLNPSPVCVGWSQSASTLPWQSLAFCLKNDLCVHIKSYGEIDEDLLLLKMFHLFNRLVVESDRVDVTASIWFGLVCITGSFVLAMLIFCLLAWHQSCNTVIWLKSASSCMVLSFRRKPTMAMSSTHLNRKQQWRQHTTLWCPGI